MSAPHNPSPKAKAARKYVVKWLLIYITVAALIVHLIVENLRHQKDHKVMVRKMNEMLREHDLWVKRFK